MYTIFKVLLAEIIQNNQNIRKIQQYYEKNKKLTDDLRKNMSSEIVSYFIQNEISLTIGNCKSLAQQIVQIFPTEIAVTTHLFI